MLVFFIGISTGMQGTTPDLKKNSKTEKLKMEPIVKVANQFAGERVHIQINKDIDYLGTVVVLVPAGNTTYTAPVQFSKTVKAKPNFTYRSPRDSLWQNKS